jgi:CubicO group peptidase (beta-lactamase class C family)
MACRTLSILSLILGTGLIVACNNSNNDNPVGSDDTKIANPLQDSSLIDKTIQTVMTNNPIPGMAVSIITNPENPVIWSKGYGVKNIETASPVTENTSFWLGSVSKAVMGSAIMIAQEKSFLNLDDDVRALVSTHGRFRIDNPESRTITLKHLTTHTSGIIDNDGKYACAYFINNDDGTQTKLVNLFDIGITCPEDGPTTLPGFLAAYLDSSGVYYDSKENFSTIAPGENFNYSNIGAGLAGYSLELATSQTLAEFATDNIFTPLDMANTSWRYDDLDPANVATPYQVDDGQVIPLPNYELATWPDGGLRSSASDMARLLSTIMNDGTFGKSGASILQASSVGQMLTPATDEHGVFWEINESLEYGGKKHLLIGHSGSDPGAFSFIYFNPVQDIGIVIVATGDDDEIDEQVLEDLKTLLFESGELMQ